MILLRDETPVNVNFFFQVEGERNDIDGKEGKNVTKKWQTKQSVAYVRKRKTIRSRVFVRHISICWQRRL